MTEPRPSFGRSMTSPDRSALIAALLEHLLSQRQIPRERQIFVNRTLRMESIRYVGFDLDWTLADYERLPLEELTFGLTLDRLIDHHGYPETIRRVEFRPDFPRRGLLIDKEAGTILRMNRHRYVNLAYHGRERLDRGELRRLYRYEPVQPSSARFYHLDSLFELPEANLYAELIELTRHDGHSLPDSWRMFEDLRAAIDWVHACGSLKHRLMTDTETFLKRDYQLGIALSRLALGGRRLFLLTNSDWVYANAICSYLFDGLLPGVDTWRDLFDLVIVGAAKPDFFRSRREFQQLSDDGEIRSTVTTPEWGAVFSGGCLEGLMQLIGEPGERILYVGDHIYGDVVSSKLESTWRTTLIVRELEEEIRGRAEHTVEIASARAFKQRLADLGHEMDHSRDLVLLDELLEGHGLHRPQEAQAALRSRHQRTRREHRETLRLEASRAEQAAQFFNPYWGSFFKQGTSKTRFASQLETYACLYTSRVSNFSLYGSNRYFRVTLDPMMHELDDSEFR